MSQLDSAQTIAREAARLSTGRFGTQEHSAPETPLTGPTPKQLGMVGAGPASLNAFADSWDKDEDRPLRPYLPLTPGDDDEFFDAPEGAQVTIVQENGRETRLRAFVRTAVPTEWEERDALSGTFQGDVPVGDVWAEMFADDGSMRSTLLHAPVGMLYSDQRYYIPRTAVDKPLTLEEATARLADARLCKMVSRSLFGDRRDDGVPEAFQGELSVNLSEAGYIQLSGVGRNRGAYRGFLLDQVEIFGREGDIVFRQEHDQGYGWEECIRVIG